jgi:hypothetical protein
LGTATDKKLTVILGQNRGFVRFLVLVSVYAIDWTWFEKEGQVSKGHKKLTIKAFDIILLLRHLLNRNIRCKPIFEGNKCMLLELPQFEIRFIDSHRYITGPLDSFTKRFPSIPSELSKGCFPYKFNQPRYYDYIGKVPPLSMFVDDFSNPKKVKSAQTFIDQYNGTYTSNVNYMSTWSKT